MRSRWMQIVFAGLVLVVALELRFADPQFLSDLRLKSFDTYQQVLPRKYQPVPVRFIDLDDESLSRVGQWPWPRTQVAALVEKLNAAGAAAITLDIVFSEPDRTSPAQLIASWPAGPKMAALREQLAAMPDHDDLLAQAIDRAKNVVTGFMLTDGSGGGDALVAKAGFAFAGDDPRAFLGKTYTGAVLNLPQIEAAGRGAAGFNLTPEHDGLVRRVPLLVDYMGVMFPTPALESLRIAQGASGYLVRASNASGAKVLGGAQTGITHVRVGRMIVPTDRNGRMWLYDTGPVPERRIPAWKVLSGEADPELLRGAIVFVGTSAAGLHDTWATPLSPATSGAELQVQLTEQILLQQFLERPDWADGAELSLLAVLGIVLALATSRLGAGWSAVLATGAIAGIAGLSWYLFARHGLLLDPVYPAITGTMVYSGSSMMGYLRSETERRQIRNAFSHYMSPVMVERLARNPDQLHLGGETRELTLLFCDLRGFTTISEKYDAQQLTSLVNRFLTPVTDVTLANGGTIDKYMGDAMMAFWNAPLDDPDHATHAVRAALEMNRRMGPLNEELAAEAAEQGTAFSPLKIGIGLNTGLACVGNMGSRQRFDYSALGDEVNLASRLEGLSKQYGVDIVMSGATRNRVSGFVMLELDRIRVVGKTVPVTIFTLLDEASAGQDPTIAAGLAEQEAMLAAYRDQDWDFAQDLVGVCRRMLSPRFGLDKYYTLIDERIEAYRLTPPPANWNGVADATRK